MEKVTGIPGEHMTREQTLEGVEAIIGKSEATTETDDKVSSEGDHEVIAVPEDK